MSQPFPVSRVLRWRAANLNAPKPGERYLVVIQEDGCRRWAVAEVDRYDRLEVATAEGPIYTGWRWSDVVWCCPISELSPTVDPPG